MAIDPRIALMGQVPDVSQAINIFENALMNTQNRRLAQAQEERAQQLMPFQLQQQQQAVDLNQQALASGEAQAAEQQENRILRSVAEFGQQLKPALQSGDDLQALVMLDRRLGELDAQGLPTNETLEAIEAIKAGNRQGVINSIDSAQQMAQQRGLLGTPQKSVGQRDFEINVQTVKNDPELQTVEGKAAAVALGLEARASSSAKERIAKDPELTNAVAESEGTIAESTETGKQKSQLKFKPQITRAVKLAEKQAAEKGEVLTDLARMEASLPGIKEAVNELLELSDAATSTLGGRAFDFLVKESGFGSTKGADARAKLIAIVDNQVLPLLKETFGAAFTVQEGENLKASLVDPNASPDQKRQQLEAFLAQKERNIRTKQTQLSESPEDEFAGFKVVR